MRMTYCENLIWQTCETIIILGKLSLNSGIKFLRKNFLFLFIENIFVTKLTIKCIRTDK